MTLGQKLRFVEVGGASFVKFPPLFSPDGKLLFCPCGSSVKVFSTTTGECVRKLTCNGVVTGIVQHPNNKLQVISSTRSGSLQVWDYEDGFLLKSVKVGSSILGLFCDPNIKNWAFLVENRKETVVLKRVPLNPISQNSADYQEIAQGLSRGLSQPVETLLSGKYIVCLKDKEICVTNVEEVTEFANHKAVKDGQVTCFACHPLEDCIATGHRGGKINIWHKVCPVSDKSNFSIVSTYHWHHHPPASLSFTPGGSSLLSVGAESVLVQWHYKDGSKQSFASRLGSSCNHVVTSADGIMYATTHNDNSITILSNNFSITQTIQGLTHLRGGQSSHKLFQYDPRTRSCVTMGKPGHLIFYDPVEDREVYTLDITHENFISSNDKSHLLRARITCVAHQGDSKNENAWMATMETSQMGKCLNENKLKFWLIDETDKWWKLNTVINHPHSEDVTNLCFRPITLQSDQSDMVSTGSDGMVKLWRFGQSHSYWSCVATASYRELPASYCDFSQDGSVLGVAFNHVVCLLDPSTLETSLVIQSHEKNEAVEKLVFGRHACQQMLIIQSKSCVQGYDLLNGMLSWVADMSISHIATDPCSEFMYMLATDSSLHVIRPSSPELVHTQKCLSLGNVMSMVCIPHASSFHTSDNECSSTPWMAHSRLYIADSKMTVFRLSPRSPKEKRKPLGVKISLPNHFMTPMAHILDKSSGVSDDPTQSVNASQLTEKHVSEALKMITDSPAHVLPSVANYCGDFLASFLETLKIDEPEVGKFLNGPRYQTGVRAVDSMPSKVDFSTRIVESTNILQPRVPQMKFLSEL